MKTAYFTICARNYLAYALTLRDSLLGVEPDANVFIFLADEPLPNSRRADFILPMEVIKLPDREGMVWRYTVMELATAIKPFCFDHLFDVMGFDRVIYLDPDIEAFAPLSAVHTALDAGAASVLTPHLLAPLNDDARPTTHDIMQSGVFNLGFAAFAKAPEARRFITWWGEQLVDNCLVDLERGLFVDQKFVDLAPSFLADLHVLRDPGYNVAYWNLSERPVDRDGENWTAGGEPLVFFHFSGVVPGDPTVFSKHQDRFDMTNSGAAADLVRAYLDQLAEHDHAGFAQMSYAWGSFSDGSPIPAVMRRHPPDPGVDPFTRPDLSYWNSDSEQVDPLDGHRFTRLMKAVHDSRIDLQERFPLTTASGQAQFRAWFVRHGAAELKLTEAVLGPALEKATSSARSSGAASWPLRLGFLPPRLRAGLSGWLARQR